MSRALRVLRSLTQRRDAVGVVRLAERWSEEGGAPREARLAEARAFLQLYQVDRAWVRLRELTDEDADDVDALVLTAEMFVERGWPARARKILSRVSLLESGHPGLKALSGRAAAEPLQPPADARDIERTGSQAQVLALAERYLAAGSVIRARGLLERIRRAEPGHARANALLWGVRGEFSARQQTLDQLLDELDPSDVVEHTESVDLADLDAADPDTAEVRVALAGRPGALAAFPSLFRHDPSDPVGGGGIEDEEVTVAAMMASPEEMLDPPTQERTGFLQPAHDGSGDTQILEVIPSGGGRLRPAAGPLHEPRPRNSGQPVDLKAWQKSMGMSGASADAADLDGGGFLEDEDEDLVVLTRREERAPDRTPRARSGPIEVVEKFPVPVVPLQRVPLADEDTPPASPTPLSAAPEAAAPAHGADASDALDVFSGRPNRRLIIALGGMAAVMVGVGWGSVGYLQRVASADIQDEVHEALEGGDYRALLEIEAGLGQQVADEVPPLGARAAELALVEAVLWHEYTGDPSHRDRAKSALSVAAENGGAASDQAAAAVLLAVDAGDLAAARQAAGRLDLSRPEGRYVLALLRIAANDGAGAVDALGADVVGPRHVRALTVAQALAANPDAARAASERAGEWGLVLSEELGLTADASDARLATMLSIAEGSAIVAPRLRSRAHAARATLFSQLGRHPESASAWDSALAVDVNSVAAAVGVGASQLRAGEVRAAAETFSACLEVHPGASGCQRGMVQVYLELDQVVEARAAVASWPLDGGLSAWVSFAEGDAEGARNAVATWLQEQTDAGRTDGLGLGWYIAGASRGELGGDRDEAERALLQAVRHLRGSSSALDRVLGDRAAAALVEYGSPARADARARELTDSSDAMVRIHLGRWLDAESRSAEAAAQMVAARKYAGERALAWYHYGLFQYDPRRSIGAAQDAWRVYLDLGPTGPRATRAGERVGR